VTILPHASRREAKGRIKSKNLKCQHILSVVGPKEIEIHRKKEEKIHPDIKK
jgi:hypothetical protein